MNKAWISVKQSAVCELLSNLEVCEYLKPAAGHEYDVSGVFATNPKDAPGPGELSLFGHSLYTV